eukprot:m51a1_g7134 putative lim-type zinc finger-containing protein (151) ;mRNA; f:267496-268277
MPTAKCAICDKSAYPLESVTAIDKTYHKGCFKCEVCHLQLTLSNYKGLEGKIYCSKHVPKAHATAVTDSVAIRQATTVPKRTAEGLGNVQRGTGGKPSVTVFGAEGGAAPAEGGQYQDQQQEQPQEQYQEQPQEQPQDQYQEQQEQPQDQ